jgi:hypothetical protein
MASNEDDLAAILNLPPVNSERMDIMDDRCEVADTIIEINMSGLTSTQRLRVRSSHSTPTPR